jgi:hypothetical protein
VPRPRDLLAGVALALLAGCPSVPPAQVVLDAGATPHAAGPPPLPLSLPSGWLVNAGADGVVRATGPRGQPVLRAEVQRGVGLPTAATLRTGFLGGLRTLKERSEQLTEAPGFIALRFVLVEADAGPSGPPGTEALLSATALGEDTLLCASLREASHAELDVVQAACQAAAAPSR